MQRIINYVSIVLIIMLFDNCKKDMVGPDIESFGNQPQVNTTFTRSRDTIKMPLSEAIYFNVSFEEDVQWEINLKGEESGAHAKLTGVSSLVNQSNSSWTGIADNPPAKFVNENVTAVLTFPNSPNLPSQTVKFYVFATGAFNNTGSVLVSDFSNTKFYAFGTSHPNDGSKWWAADYPLPTTSNTALEPSPAGNKYVFISGSTKLNNPYVTYTELKPADRDNGLSTDLTFPLYVDPTKVYFNIYVYNTVTSGTNYAWLSFQFTETDGSKRVYELKQPNWEGWKLISIKYSDLTLTGGATGTGNPDQLSLVGIALLGNQTDLSTIHTVSVAIDHPIFTFGKPYQP